MTMPRARPVPAAALLLAAQLAALKAAGQLGWPWEWVLAPLWVPLAFLVAAIGLLAALIGIYDTFSRDNEKESHGEDNERGIHAMRRGRR